MYDEANVLLVYLPLYSPNFNLIETLFAIFKAWIKRHNSVFLFYTETESRFGRFLEPTLEAVTPDISHDAGALFQVANIEYS